MDFRYLHGFYVIDFQRFRGMGAYVGKGRPAAPKETFAPFKFGSLSSDDIQRILLVFTNLLDFLLCP